MNRRLITDRAEALALFGDESSGECYPPIPIARAAPVQPPRADDAVACPWCGSFSAPGPGCDLCGSPLS